MKKEIYECDICKRQVSYLDDGWIKLKCKQRYTSGYGSDAWWNKKTLLICPECNQSINYAALLFSKLNPAHLNFIGNHTNTLVNMIETYEKNRGHNQ